MLYGPKLVAATPVQQLHEWHAYKHVTAFKLHICCMNAGVIPSKCKHGYVR